MGLRGSNWSVAQADFKARHLHNRPGGTHLWLEEMINLNIAGEELTKLRMDSSVSEVLVM